MPIFTGSRHGSCPPVRRRTGVGSVSLSIQELADGIHSEPRAVASAIDWLINRHCLIAVTPGRAQSPNVYHIALPKRLLAVRHMPAIGEALPF